MAGTKLGGLRAAETNRKKYGKDFFRNIGKIGGAKGRTGGFASDLVGADGLTGIERARTAGRLGGQRSKRKPRADK